MKRASGIAACAVLAIGMVSGARAGEKYALQEQCADVEYVSESLNYIYHGINKEGAEVDAKSASQSVYIPLHVLIQNSPACLVAAYRDLDPEARAAILAFVRNGERNCLIENGKSFVWCKEEYPVLLQRLKDK